MRWLLLLSLLLPSLASAKSLLGSAPAAGEADVLRLPQDSPLARDVAAAVAHAAPQVAAVSDLSITAPADNDGLNLDLEWTAVDGAFAYAVVRKRPDGDWVLVTETLPAGSNSFGDKVTTDAWEEPPATSYEYKLITLAALPPTAAEDATDAERIAQLQTLGQTSSIVEGIPEASLMRTQMGALALMGLILGVGGLMLWFTRQARLGKPIEIRRIPGIDAIEEGIGRATEMGRPVLYVPGIDELQDIQTIASMLILGQVSKTVAEYQSDIIVSCCIPIVREVADEVVRAGFFQAGHPDAYRPVNTRFISSEQFAFCAGTNGIISREKPSTNIYLGRFFAESLILAETGFVNKSIQIAGTAEATQLPFFIAACDYTLIGEELFAVSAYLSGDPRLVSSLKASDWVKVVCVWAITVGTITVTLGTTWLQDLFTIAGG